MAPATAAKKAVAASAGVNFGDLSMYAGGGVFLPEGDYILTNCRIEMFKGEKSTRAAKLSVLIDVAELTNPAEVKVGVWSMGGKAHESFQPNPDGTGLVPVPGGPAATLNDSTNWSLFLKSLYDSGLPQGIFTNDLSVLNGTWVHIANVPEPESRKQMGSRAKTGEAAAEPERQGNGMVAVVTEIKDDGKPWENTGGIPAEAPKSPGKASGVVSKPALTPAPVEESDDDVETAAINAVAAVLEKNSAGCPKLVLRTSVFKAVNAKNPEMAQQVISTYFKDKDGDEVLNGLLEGLGYTLAGNAVKPAA